MLDFREIERLRKDPRAALLLAQRLLNFRDHLDDRQLAFLEDIVHEKAPRAISDQFWPLTTRQLEWLVDIRDGLKDHHTVNGFSVARLLEEAWLNRFELDNDEHIEFLDRNKGRTTLKARQIGLLLHIARRLQLVEQYA